MKRVVAASEITPQTHEPKDYATLPNSEIQLGRGDIYICPVSTLSFKPTSWKIKIVCEIPVPYLIILQILSRVRLWISVADPCWNQSGEDG